MSYITVPYAAVEAAIALAQVRQVVIVPLALPMPMCVHSQGLGAVPCVLLAADSTRT
jgi:hypothetical protein